MLILINNSIIALWLGKGDRVYRYNYLIIYIFPNLYCMNKIMMNQLTNYFYDLNNNYRLQLTLFLSYKAHYMMMNLETL